MRNKEHAHLSDVLSILGMVKGITGMLVFSSVTRLMCKLMSIAIPTGIAILVQKSLTGNENALSWFLVIAALLGASALLSYLDTYVSHDVSFRIVKELQDYVYDHMDRIAPGGLAGRNAADSAMVILSDVSVFEWFVAHCLVEWIGTFFSLLIAMVFLCRVSSSAAVVLLGSIALMISIPLFSKNKAKEKGYTMKRLYGELNGVISDGINGHKDIIAAHWTKAFMSRLASVSNKYSDAQRQFAIRGECEKTYMAVIASTAVISSVLLSSLHCDYWNLLPVFVLSASTVGCVQGTLSESTNFGFVFGAATRIVSVLNVAPPVEDSGTMLLQDIQSPDGQWTLSFKNVAFQYPNSRLLLENITFSVNSTETIAIVGASGEGKTTLAKLLQRYWDITMGSIQINGADIRSFTLAALRDMVMLLPQDPFLFHGSIRQNLLLAKPDATDCELELAIELAQASLFVRKLEQGIDSDLGENGGRLSGGEKQRIALAQAFLKNPPILVLDEATSALDTQHDKCISAAVRIARRDKITIVIAHRLSTMQCVDRIVFIQNGRVKATGRYCELIKKCNDFQDLVNGDYFEKEDI